MYRPLVPGPLPPRWQSAPSLPAKCLHHANIRELRKMYLPANRISFFHAAFVVHHYEETGTFDDEVQKTVVHFSDLRIRTIPQEISVQRRLFNDEETQDTYPSAIMMAEIWTRELFHVGYPPLDSSGLNTPYFPADDVSAMLPESLFSPSARSTGLEAVMKCVPYGAEIGKPVAVDQWTC